MSGVYSPIYSSSKWQCDLHQSTLGPEAFLEMPGTCGLQPCPQTHLKKALCHTRPVGGTEDKYRTSLLVSQTTFKSTNIHHYPEFKFDSLSLFSLKIIMLFSHLSRRALVWNSLVMDLNSGGSQAHFLSRQLWNHSLNMYDS